MQSDSSTGDVEFHTVQQGLQQTRAGIIETAYIGGGVAMWVIAAGLPYAAWRLWPLPDVALWLMAALAVFLTVTGAFAVLRFGAGDMRLWQLAAKAERAKCKRELELLKARNADLAYQVLQQEATLQYHLKSQPNYKPRREMYTAEQRGDAGAMVEHYFTAGEWIKRDDAMKAWEWTRKRWEAARDLLGAASVLVTDPKTGKAGMSAATKDEAWRRMQEFFTGPSGDVPASGTRGGTVV